MLIRTFAVLIACTFFGSTVNAQPDQVAAPQFDDSERELIALCDEMKSALADFYAGADAIEEGPERDAYYDANEPSAPFVDRLIEVERTHRGSNAG